jgi:hypothetical protein
MNERSDEEQRLADLLKRAVPEPPRQLTHEEISMRHLERSVKPWLMPAMAAASVLVIGGAIGAVAATRPNPAPPRASAAASQGNRAAGVQQAPGVQQEAPDCPGTATPVPSASPGSPSPFLTVPPGGNVTVPMVTGFTAGRAEQVLTQAGLFVFVQTAPAHGTPAGTVLRQAPAPGTRAPSGAVVVIIVAIKTGGPVPATSPAPSATAIPIPSATATAAPSPYPTCSASATPVPSSAPSSSPSVVPTVTPAPVTSAPVTPVPTGKPGVAPSVTPVPTTRASVTVPNVVGMQQTQAQTVLQLAGFNVLVFPNAPEPSGRPRGTIFKQSPAPGTVVPRGSQIAIYG